MSRTNTAKATFDKLIKYSEVLDKKGEFSLSSYLTSASNYHAKLILSQSQEDEDNLELEEEPASQTTPNIQPSNTITTNPDAEIPEEITRRRLHEDLSLPFLKDPNFGNDLDENVFHNMVYVSSFGPDNDKKIRDIASSLLQILKSKNDLKEAITEALDYLQSLIVPYNYKNLEEFNNQFVYFNYALGLALAYYLNDNRYINRQYFAKEIRQTDLMANAIMSTIQMLSKSKTDDSVKSEYDKYSALFQEEAKTDPTTVQSFISFLLRHPHLKQILHFDALYNEQIISIYKTPINSVLSKENELISRYNFVQKYGYDAFTKILSLQEDDRFTFQRIHAKDIRRATDVIHPNFDNITSKSREVILKHYDELKNYGISQFNLSGERILELENKFSEPVFINLIKLSHDLGLDFNYFKMVSLGYALKSGMDYEEIYNALKDGYSDKKLAILIAQKNNLTNNPDDLNPDNLNHALEVNLTSSAALLNNKFKQYPDLYEKFTSTLAANNISILNLFQKLSPIIQDSTNIIDDILSRNAQGYLIYFTNHALAIYNNGTNSFKDIYRYLNNEDINLSPEEIRLKNTYSNSGNKDKYEKLSKILEHFPNLFSIPNYGKTINFIESNMFIFDLPSEDKIKLLETFDEDHNKNSFPIEFKRTAYRFVLFDNDYSYDSILHEFNLRDMDLRLAKFIGRGYKNSNNKILIDPKMITYITNNIRKIALFFGYGTNEEDVNLEELYNNLDNLQKDGRRYNFDDIFLNPNNLTEVEKVKTLIEQKFPALTPDKEEYNLVSTLLKRYPTITNIHTPFAIIKYVERKFKQDNISLPEFSKNISPAEYGFIVDDKNDTVFNIYNKNENTINSANKEFNNLDTQIKEAIWLINWYEKTPEEERNNTLPYGLQTSQFSNPREFQDNYKSILGYSENQIRFFASLKSNQTAKNKVRMFLLDTVKNNIYEDLFDNLEEVLSKEYNTEPFDINKKIEEEISSNINLRYINNEQIRNIINITEFFGNESEKALNKFVTVKHFNPNRTKEDSENKTKFVELHSSDAYSALHDLAQLIPNFESIKYVGAKEYFLKNYNAANSDKISKIINNWNRSINAIDLTTEQPISGKISELSKTYSITDLDKFIKYDNFTNRLTNLEPEHTDFAVEFSEHIDSYFGNSNDETTQNARAHHAYEILEQIYLDSQLVPLPDWANGQSKRGKYIARFLPREDTRGMFLGEYTGCCQHPEGEAYTAAFDGQISPNACFFVVEDHTGKIHLQCYVWADEEGNVCFDSFETGSNDFYHSETKKSLLREMIEEVASTMGKRKVTGGLGPYNNSYTKIVDPNAKKTDSLINPYNSMTYFEDKLGVNFDVYETDSRNQALIVDNRDQDQINAKYIPPSYDRGDDDYEDLYTKSRARQIREMYETGDEENSYYDEDDYDEDDDY